MKIIAQFRKSAKIRRNLLRARFHSFFPEKPCTNQSCCFYLHVCFAHFMELRTGFFNIAALKSIHKLNFFKFIKWPNILVSQENSERFHIYKQIMCKSKISTHLSVSDNRGKDYNCAWFCISETEMV